MASAASAWRPCSSPLPLPLPPPPASYPLSLPRVTGTSKPGATRRHRSLRSSTRTTAVTAFCASPQSPQGEGRDNEESASSIDTALLVSDDLSYLWKLAAGSIGGASAIKYGSVLFPGITRPNIVQALLMISLPVLVAVLILVKESSKESQDEDFLYVARGSRTVLAVTNKIQTSRQSPTKLETPLPSFSPPSRPSRASDGGGGRILPPPQPANRTDQDLPGSFCCLRRASPSPPPRLFRPPSLRRSPLSLLRSSPPLPSGRHPPLRRRDLRVCSEVPRLHAVPPFHRGDNSRYFIYLFFWPSCFTYDVMCFAEEVAVLALESLVRLITMTKMKAICNLGVWCISIQQIGGSIVERHLALILKAIIHAIDNPFGSLSTAYEATQVLVKLSTQFSVEMRSMSNIWVPSLYRRLVSNNKRQRDMAERCFLKIKSIICPPSLVLSTVIISDLKQKLLPTMMEMLDVTQDNRQKILIIQAWGWYICLLGSNALNDRHLVNKMLKVPEITFADTDTQVQVATLVAWESLIDALLPPVTIHDTIQQSGPAPSSASDENIVGILRRTKVLMIPLHGIISSKLELSVRLRCLLTWQYLLHKLDLLVNHSSVKETTFWKILELIFSRGPDDENVYLWNSCIDLLDEFLLAKVKDGETILNSETQSFFPVDQATQSGFSARTNASSMNHPLKWLPWNINDLNYQLNMVSSIIHPEQIKTMTSDQRIMTLDGALKVFRSIVQGVQIEVKGLPDGCDNIRIYISTLIKFRKQVCESVAPNHNGNQFDDFSWVHAQFTEVIRDELEPSLLYSCISD